ncbi:hypothetical protein A2974_01600 [Candidatus Peregrinibacteria bacterium RIFCSPLOWO2_01_FULL_48_20]|nr:MAG: hypothetical protein A2974_01600 [Candidatus Peregrinibacteria bacterium RIFCSPLOWO2_01_FULL_48_20]
MKNLPKYLAELFGTFGLALAVSLSATGSFLPTAIIAALTLGLFVYTIGHISGAHLNPAITAGALAIGKIHWQDAIGYWVAQFVGAGIALTLSGQLVERTILNVDTEILTGAGEALGAVFFGFGVAAVIYGRIPKDVTGVAVGASLALGIAMAGHLSNGILNPAVALALGSFNWIYLVGPIVGAVVGMWLFKLLSMEK